MSPQSKPRVLIVDDSPSFRRVVHELLQRRGYVVAGEADCAVSALEATKRLAPDAILLDVGLPDRSGFDLSALLTADHPSPAVLLMSAEPELESLGRAERCGACGFVPKYELASVALERFWPSL